MFCFFLAGCNKEQKAKPFNDSAKPYTRYWWFASMISEEDVKYNLDWLKANGFGGVEIAWVYPLNRFNPEDTTYTPRQEWLSREWRSIVDFTIRYADSIGLGCDLTFGTLWPFGDSKVPFSQATQRFGDPHWRQEITRSWEHPKSGYVIDHLTPANYLPYFTRLINAFPRPEINSRQAYFIDSWEVETEKLWCDRLEEDFFRRFGYDITPYMDSVYNPGCQAQLYDYMSLISDKVLKFYSHFDSVLNSVGVLSRGQVSGAPCDLISGYALLDIPEGESMLFEPEFCAIPASAALLSGKKHVSSETFTCLYGWPDDYMRREQTADLKMVADALFANGINHIVWHGKPHNPVGYDTVSFYATTHTGPGSPMADEIPAFNRYLETVSSFMKKGATFSDIAVYMPTEDAWRAGRMPLDLQFIWAWGHYEMRYLYFPSCLDGYNPTWINAEFLQKANVSDNLLKVGNASYKAIYFDASYISYQVLKRLTALAQEGIPVILRQDPAYPGMILPPDYNDLLKELKKSENVFEEIPETIAPFIEAEQIPRHWCRKDGDTLYVFFSHPKTDRLKFPLQYGQSLENDTVIRDIKIKYEGREYQQKLVFEPYQSILLRIDDNGIAREDIRFVPKTPTVIERPSDYSAPWLVR